MIQIDRVIAARKFARPLLAAIAATSAAVFGAGPARAADAPLAPGEVAPPFTLSDQTGKVQHLSDYRGRTVVLAFYPKDFTSGCTREMKELSPEAPGLRKQKTVVLGISTQNVKSHADFAQSLKLTFPLLADNGGKVSKAYGVLNDTTGLARRVTYVIGPDGKIRSVNDHVAPPTTVPDLLTLLGGGTPAGAAAAPAKAYPGWATTVAVAKLPDGLQYQDLNTGNGAVAKAGDTVSVHYTGYLLDGTKFDSSLDRGTPFSFPLGGGQVIKGWDEGVAGMAVGGKRKLIIPAQLGYGAAGAGGVIPPNSTLVFDVELLHIN